MSKRSKGLQYNNITEEYSIDKKINGIRLRQRLRVSSLEEAEIEFDRIISEFYIHINDRQELMTFPQAGVKYINEATKKSIGRDVSTLKAAHPFLKDFTLKQVHNDSLLPYIAARKEAGIRSATVNRDLAVIHRILRLAAGQWRTKSGDAAIRTIRWNDRWNEITSI